jgi:hypothetical protein
MAGPQVFDRGAKILDPSGVERIASSQKQYMPISE